MSSTASNPSAAFLRPFTFPTLIGVGLVVVLAWLLPDRYLDLDTWWHLRVAEEIWETGDFPRQDTYSFTAAGQPWMAHQWLGEVSMFGLYKALGLPGLMLWVLLTGGLTIVGMYAYCSRVSGNPKTALLGGLAVWFFATVGLMARPLVMGHLFLVIELWVLELAREGKRRWLWVLPPLFCLWINTHGTYIYGLFVLGLAAATSFFEFEFGLVFSRRWPQETRRTLLQVIPLCGLALFANPFGLDLVLYPFDLYFNQTGVTRYLAEWMPLSFSDPRGIGFLAVVGLMALLVLLRRPRLDLSELLLIGVAGYLAIRHVRMLFLFGIFVAPLLSKLLAREWEDYHVDRDPRRLNFALIAILVVLLWARWPSDAELQAKADQQFPSRAISHVRANNIQGRMLNEFNWGGYFTWAFREQKVFADGRVDIFDRTGVLEDYMTFSLVKEQSSEILAKYSIDFCLLDKNSIATIALSELPGWRKEYEDEMAVIYVRADGAESAQPAAAAGAAGPAGARVNPL